jgi:catechol 2,3-dioxygenase-like lactoylglutathione lyase family enzyme
MPRYVEPTDQLVVEVFVRDMQRSRAFYLDLGFELKEDRGEFVDLAWEGHHLYLDERDDLPDLQLGVPMANVRIMVLDVDAYRARATAGGAHVLAPIADRDYGLRDFTILDPDGLGLRFATRL